MCLNMNSNRSTDLVPGETAVYLTRPGGRRLDGLLQSPPTIPPLPKTLQEARQQVIAAAYGGMHSASGDTFRLPAPVSCHQNRPLRIAAD